MSTQHIFNFNQDISNVFLPGKLNNPFNTGIPKIAQLAASEFQEYILSVCKYWHYDFNIQKGKMFGVLVILQENKSVGYIGAVSGTLSSGDLSTRMIPSIFNESKNDLFISNGLRAITSLGLKLKQTPNEKEAVKIKEERKALSITLQQKLFERTKCLNIKKETKNVLQIFEDGQYGYPPSAAGECAAPKLLHYAFQNNLKPLAIAEFWWGNTPKNMERLHKIFYPACKEKCRPILEYMLDDSDLFVSSRFL